MSYCDITPQFYTEARVRARKPHKCCETGRLIQPGEFYWRIAGKWDGDVLSYAQSEAAYHFARWMNKVGERGREYDECIPFGGVPDAVMDCDNDAIKAEYERVKLGEITRTT